MGKSSFKRKGSLRELSFKGPIIRSDPFLFLKREKILREDCSLSLSLGWLNERSSLRRSLLRGLSKVLNLRGDLS